MSTVYCKTLFSAPEFNETWQEARSQRPLPSLCFSGWSENQDGHPGLWLAETFSTFPQKPLNRIQRILTGSKISMSSTKFVFFGLISIQKLLSWLFCQKGGTLYSGAQYVALWASCYSRGLHFCTHSLIEVGHTWKQSHRQLFFFKDNNRRNSSTAKKCHVHMIRHGLVKLRSHEKCFTVLAVK